jgi:hypothetical protein
MKPEDVDKMTLQEFLDYAVKKIVEQGERCLSGTGCSYGKTEIFDNLPPRVTHCGIGWGLDEHDGELMSYGRGVMELVDEFGRSGRIPKLMVDNLQAMQRLQSFHDCVLKHDREFNMKKLREDRGIDTSGPHWQQWVDMGSR